MKLIDAVEVDLSEWEVVPENEARRMIKYIGLFGAKDYILYSKIINKKHYMITGLDGTNPVTFKPAKE